MSGVRALTSCFISLGASGKEKIAAWPVMPLLRRAIAKGIGMNKPNARERSWEQIRAVFDEVISVFAPEASPEHAPRVTYRCTFNLHGSVSQVDAALADGRPFICGERFTAADLTFAALAGPALAAPGYVPFREENRVSCHCKHLVTGARTSCSTGVPFGDKAPKELAEQVQKLRQTDAGKVSSIF